LRFADLLVASRNDNNKETAMLTKTKIALAAAALTVAATSTVVAEDVSPADIVLTKNVTHSQRVITGRAYARVPYYSGTPRTEDFIDQRTGF
jgi:hypothetical protein